MSQMQGLAHFLPTPTSFELDQAAKLVFYREDLTSGARSGRSFTIGLAYDDHDYRSASEIINRLYGQRGYGSEHQVLTKPECMTFTACCEEEMIGTLTLRVDSLHRLGADETFPTEMANLRAPPHVSLCELTKFAFEPSRESRPLLAKLFHVIFVYGRQRFACSDLVIEVNPRHVSFYETMLGFACVGTPRTNASVHAPSHLMRLAVSEIGRNIAFREIADNRSSRSLYSHFLNESEVRNVRLRIAASIC